MKRRLYVYRTYLVGQKRDTQRWRITSKSIWSATNMYVCHARVSIYHWRLLLCFMCWCRIIMYYYYPSEHNATFKWILLYRLTETLSCFWDSKTVARRCCVVANSVVSDSPKHLHQGLFVAWNSADNWMACTDIRSYDDLICSFRSYGIRYNSKDVTTFLWNLWILWRISSQTIVVSVILSRF